MKLSKNKGVVKLKKKSFDADLSTKVYSSQNLLVYIQFVSKNNSERVNTSKSFSNINILSYLNDALEQKKTRKYNIECQLD